MTRFRFRLDTVLKLRHQEERQHQRRVAEVARLRQECEQRLEELSQAREGCSVSLRELAGWGPLDVRRVSAVCLYGRQLEFQQREIRERLRVVNEELTKRQQELAEASKRRQVLEKVRDLQADRYRQEMEKREQVVLDEVGGQQFVRRNQESRYASGASYGAGRAGADLG